MDSADTNTDSPFKFWAGWVGPESPLEETLEEWGVESVCTPDLAWEHAMQEQLQAFVNAVRARYGPGAVK